MSPKITRLAGTHSRVNAVTAGLGCHTPRPQHWREGASSSSCGRTHKTTRWMPSYAPSAHRRHRRVRRRRPRQGEHEVRRLAEKATPPPRAGGSHLLRSTSRDDCSCRRRQPTFSEQPHMMPSRSSVRAPFLLIGEAGGRRWLQRGEAAIVNIGFRSGPRAGPTVPQIYSAQTTAAVQLVTSDGRRIRAVRCCGSTPSLPDRSRPIRHRRQQFARPVLCAPWCVHSRCQSPSREPQCSTPRDTHPPD